MAVKASKQVLNDGLEQQRLTEVHGMVAEQVLSALLHASAAASSGSDASSMITSDV